MTCSKLFSGDLPEISTDIIQNLHNDFNTLYSLALVNRFWCRLSISLLWEDPFSIKYQEQEDLTSHFLDVYYLFFNDDDKNKVKGMKYNYEPNSNLYNPLFNYPSLIKTLNLHRMKVHVESWLNATYNNTSTTSSSKQSS